MEWMHDAWASVAALLQQLPTAAIARVCLVLMFPFSAIDKVLHWPDAVEQASSSFIPEAFAPPMLILAMVLEVAAPICIVSGWQAEPAAFVLALYCAVTALLFHAFWRFPDFWKPGTSIARNHFWDFTKNFGLVGGLLLVAAGRGF